MNTFTKLSVAGVLGMLTLVAAASVCSLQARADEPANFAAAVAQVDALIARDAASYLKAAPKAQRTARVRQSPSVQVTEDSVMVVTATRLPARDSVIEAHTARTAQVRL